MIEFIEYNSNEVYWTNCFSRKYMVIDLNLTNISHFREKISDCHSSKIR
jgi:hypothetical protein